MDPFSLCEYMDAENVVSKETIKCSGVFFINTNNLLILLIQMITSCNSPYLWLFLGIFTQVRNSLLLAFISILRKHDIQGLMMLRYAVESISQAAYAMLNAEKFNEHIKQLTEGEFSKSCSEKIKNEAYVWIQSNFEDHSKRLKSLKDWINNMYAHADICMIMKNMNVDDFSRISTCVFDNYDGTEHDNFLLNQRIWTIGNTALLFMDLIYQINAKHFQESNNTLLILTSDFHEKMRDYSKKDSELRSLIIKI